MGKFLARLLLFLIVAAGAGYLLFPTAIDQYTLYKNTPLLQAYRDMAAGLDADAVFEKKQPCVDWNTRQLQNGFATEVEPDMNVLWSSKENKSLLAAAMGKDPFREIERKRTNMFSRGNEEMRYRAVTQSLRLIKRDEVRISPLEAEDPFTAERNAASSLLPAGRDGVIGILEIPRIGVTLPVYAERTQKHLESGLFYGPGASLPIGGEGTHSMLAGSGGLDAPKLLADIGLTGPKMLEDMNQLIEGDLFIFSILDQTMVYQINQITAAPSNESIILERSIYSEQMTIVSAARDGGRLIVRGTRIEPSENAETIIKENEASELPYWVNVLVLAAPVLAFGLLAMLVTEIVMHHRYRLPSEKK